MANVMGLLGVRNMILAEFVAMNLPRYDASLREALRKGEEVFAADNLCTFMPQFIDRPFAPLKMVWTGGAS